jgi:hypothetical protein
MVGHHFFSVVKDWGHLQDLTEVRVEGGPSDAKFNTTSQDGQPETYTKGSFTATTNTLPASLSLG